MSLEKTKDSIEMPEKKGPWLLYDGACPFCLRLANRWRGTIERRGIGMAPLQAEWVGARLNLPEEELLRDMRLLTADNRLLAGVDAYVYLWRRIWWCFPLWLLTLLPGVRWIMRRAYRWVAEHRACLSGACALHGETKPKCSPGLIGWLPVLALPAAAIGFRGEFPETWIFMWVLAFAIFLGCKWLTWSRARAEGCVMGIGRPLGYLFLSTDMNAKGFMANDRPVAKPASLEWLSASVKLLLGIFTLWELAPMIGEGHPVLASWVGMLGIILVLHFGLFHLLALAWRSLGVAAEPIMRSPASATSLSAFWSKHWNRGFNQLAHDLIFRNTFRRLGVGPAIMLVFLVSGLVHDLVISLPAGACFGLPTAYFLLQGVGVMIERSRRGRSLSLHRGPAGWAFAFAFTAGPAYWLFHEAFILNVIHPFLKAIKAL